MDSKINIIGKLVEISYGVDYADRYFRPANLHTYVFENGKQRYVWQSKQRCELGLTEGYTYHIKAVVGDRLLGGRGMSLNEVDFIGEMNINNKVARLIAEE